MVTADGRKVVASEDENPELFWGVRGGGGNFGVVTAFHLRLHPIPPLMLGGLVIYPAEMGRDVLRFWREYMLNAPNEVGSGMAFVSAPQSPRSWLHRWIAAAWTLFSSSSSTAARRSLALKGFCKI